MKVEKTVEFKVSFIRAKCKIRYPDENIKIKESEFNNFRIPCLINQEYWCPIINVSNGLITNWSIGISVEIHAKVCDEGYYEYLDKNQNIIKTEEGYVPEFLCPSGEGYGDYIIMKINKEGKIENWNSDYIIKSNGDHKRYTSRDY